MNRARADANNPSLEGVQNNPSRAAVTQMVRGVLEGYRLNSGFPLQFSIIGRDAYNLQHTVTAQQKGNWLLGMVISD